MEANPNEMKSITVHEGVPKEEAAVKFLEPWRCAGIDI
jgi:hypothetical protein